MNRIIVSGLMALCAVGMGTARAEAVRYFTLPSPKPILPRAQSWEGDQQPHTLSVLELNRGGFRYWGWYGLNNGRGTGLARSNDLVHWTKYEKNPLWLNARWTSALQVGKAGLLYFAITRDYDTPSSRIVLATSKDGIHLTQIKTLVQAVPNERNQNPDLFRDPVSGKFLLIFYRGNDTDYFDIVARSAGRIEDLATAPDKLLLHATETVAAPNLLYVPHGGLRGKGIYYLATEIYPGRYGKTETGVWEVKVFHADQPDGHFEPVAGNPVQAGGRACLFQHIFGDKYHGYESHLDPVTGKWGMEALVVPLAK
ncbi:MAG TPA: hypothetical protein VHY36_00040 [Steroidobacteraceae bacterium]|nr:hypothetical protein [Steroidobacteraceae bacterium]